MATQLEYRFVCALRNGLHARPASMIAEVVRRFAAQVTIASEDGATADARSVLSIVGLDIKHGSSCVATARGEDATAVLAALRELIEGRLATGDELPSPVEEAGPRVRLPMVLRRQGIPHATGRTACAGVGSGMAVVVSALSLPAGLRDAKAASVEAEEEAACRAVAGVRQSLRDRSAEAGHGLESELLAAHAEIADDPALLAEIERNIRAGSTAAQAVVAAAERFSASLRSAASAYIRDRVIDVQDVCHQLLERLAGASMAAHRVVLTGPSVVFAETLTPNQLLQLDRSLLAGLVLGRIGATAHTVILARSHRIPTLIDVPGAGSLVASGTRVVVDAADGFVVTTVAPVVERYYEREARVRDRLLARQRPLAATPAITRDGARLEVGINASTAEEVAAGVANGADGVGLLRTELLFLDRATAPSEDEQFDAYAGVVRAAAGRPVIIRTFDIGGDKPAAYLRMPREENPFLGCRGLRLYERHPGLLRTQLRAILRASTSGPVKIMAPMVATPTEAAWFRHQVVEAQHELRDASIAFDAEAPVGIMIEIPATALVMDQLCSHVDFFSIGTNDLCQYWMAVDRGNSSVASLYDARQPSFLRLLRTIVQGAHANGKWIGVCGEMAGDRLNLPVMVALGVDEISVAPGDVMALKSAVRQADAARCRDILDAASGLREASAVTDFLRSAAWKGGADGSSRHQIVATETIEVGSDASSKEEAIKAAVDLLYVAGRTDRPREVEEAVWAREETYSTGLGYGFAIPHCKTDAVDAPTLAVLKLASPIQWGSMDGKAVEVVILLAIPASDTTGAHMKVFARLARRLMHEGFREAIQTANDPGVIHQTLCAELEIA